MSDLIFQQQRHARGYVFAQVPSMEVPSFWSQEKLGSWYLSRDPRTPYATATFSGVRVTILGTVIGRVLAASSATAIATTLARMRHKSLRVFDEAVSKLSGRCVVVCSIANRNSLLEFQQIGSPLRSLIYASDGSAIGSHETLVSSVANDRGRPNYNGSKLRRENLRYAPGLQTGFTGLRRLTANTRLIVSSGEASLERIPQQAPQGLDVKSAAEEVRALLSENAEQLFSQNERVLVPLTAGLDSRTTLSFLRPYLNQCVFFTYELKNSPRPAYVKSDVNTAKFLAEQLGLRHEVVSVEGNSEIPSEAREVFRLNNSRPSVTGVAFCLQKKFSDISIHLTSFLYGIGSAHYHGRARPALNPESMTSLISRVDSTISESAIKAFEEFVSKTAFPSEEGWISSYERFYWEHRASVWAAGVCLDLDWAQENLTLPSSRRVFEYMMSVPREDRRSRNIQYEMISQLWPELLTAPVNRIEDSY